MKLIKTILVPTGEIYVAQGRHGMLEFLNVKDYGKNQNIKADFLGFTRELNGVPNGEPLSLAEKWVLTISTQYGCSMGCKFCDVPKVGVGRNIPLWDMVQEVALALERHPEITYTKRLNVHYARMGEPTWNPHVIRHARILKDIAANYLECETVHPVVSTMLPKANKSLREFLEEWCNIKNYLYDGEAGLQFSINSTDNAQRNYLFSGNALSIEDVAELADILPTPNGRKYTLNFALADDSIIDAKYLRELFSPNKWICKITPLHRTSSSEDNGIKTTGGYDSFVPYKKVEEELKNEGFDVIVFVPSYDEDNGMITCGNAILSGKLPTSKFDVVEY